MLILQFYYPTYTNSVVQEPKKKKMLHPPFTTMVLRHENAIKAGLIWAIYR